MAFCLNLICFIKSIYFSGFGRNDVALGSEIQYFQCYRTDGNQQLGDTSFRYNFVIYNHILKNESFVAFAEMTLHAKASTLQEDSRII